jgi:hypothetical protein
MYDVSSARLACRVEFWSSDVPVDDARGTTTDHASVDPWMLWRRSSDWAVRRGQPTS